MSAILTMITKIGKIIWLTAGSLIVLWIGYLIYKLQLVNGPGSKLLLIFLLMFSLVIAVAYSIITIAGKITSFGIKKINNAPKK